MDAASRPAAEYGERLACGGAALEDDGEGEEADWKRLTTPFPSLATSNGRGKRPGGWTMESTLHAVGWPRKMKGKEKKRTGKGLRPLFLPPFSPCACTHSSLFRRNSAAATELCALGAAVNTYLIQDAEDERSES
jgi:hypothetical protein